MAKHKVAQKYIFKITTDRLKKAKWKLQLSIEEARSNDEVISISDSQMLRWIDEINGVGDMEGRVRAIYSEIRALRKKDNATPYRRRIKELYKELDSIQFKPDYMHLVVDHNKDFLRACRGFTINDVHYVRLLGTSGGIKNNTVVFVNRDIAPVLVNKIDNGRNKDVPMVPAKFEAYRALTCSGSTPVSMPNGVLVVNDCVTHFKEDVLYLTDENDGEPEMRLWKDFDVELTESDGYGLMLPSLAKRWSEELGLNYMASAFNTRQSWEKGCVFAFDFIEFADSVAGTRIVHDAWGHEVDVGSVELILTTSMLKLWQCYDSIEHYLRCCEENGYTFGITKVAPDELEDIRALNYQFIQSYDLTDDQIDELIQPTIDHIRDVVAGDYRKALLFMCGTSMNDDTVMLAEPYYKAMMVEPKLFNDPFIKQRINHAIHKRIEDAKIGVLDVHGNYSILCGDPFALCQSIFGMEVTGLLKRGEVYNKYWLDCGASDVACFRAPMSCHANILKRAVASGDDVQRWYQYITTCTLFNAWDDGCAALNGADKDGDIVFLTDNRVLVDNIKPTLTLVCAQKSATKKIITEEDLIQSNIDGFGNEVGKVTNRVTSMYDVRAQYEPGSIEYETLDYRIQCGQLYQQNSIDKTKGIVCKPMPKYWYERRAIEIPPEDADEDRVRLFELQRNIVADRKPYFMTYVYPRLMREYKAYQKATEFNASIRFGKSIRELENADIRELTDDELEFMGYYRRMLPVGKNQCTMNRICKKVEVLAAQIKLDSRAVQFDYTILKSGADYKRSQYYAVRDIYLEHKEKLKLLTVQGATRFMSHPERSDFLPSFIHRFKRSAEQICSNADELCDIVLDLCYTHEGTKQFAWDVAGQIILSNLLGSHNYIMNYPQRDANGDIEYMSGRYAMKELVIGVDDLGDSPE